MSLHSSSELDPRVRLLAALTATVDLLDAQEPHAYQPRNGKIERWRFRPSSVQLTLAGHGSADIDLVVAGRALGSHMLWCVANLFVHPGRIGSIQLRASSNLIQTFPGRVANCRYIAQRAHEIEFRFDTAVEVGLLIPDAVERRVLVADDEPLSRALIERFLRKLNADVVTVESGAQAIERSASGSFDLVIVDIEMPGMDGFATAAALREAGCAAPMAALTAHSSPEMEKRCADAGFDSFMPKPVNIDKLRVLLALAGRQPILSGLAGDADMADLIDEFVAKLPERAAAILKARAANRTAELTALASSLKSDAGGLGFASISDAAKCLEETTVRGDPDRQRDAARRLLQLCTRVRAAPAAPTATST